MVLRSNTVACTGGFGDADVFARKRCLELRRHGVGVVQHVPYGSVRQDERKGGIHATSYAIASATHPPLHLFAYQSVSQSVILLLFNCIGFFGFSSTLIYKNCRHYPARIAGRTYTGDKFPQFFSVLHLHSLSKCTSSAFTEQVFFSKVERPACSRSS